MWYGITHCPVRMQPGVFLWIAFVREDAIKSVFDCAYMSVSFGSKDKGIVTPMSQPHDNIFNIINITLGHIWVTLIVNNVLCRSAITI